MGSTSEPILLQIDALKHEIKEIGRATEESLERLHRLVDAILTKKRRHQLLVLCLLQLRDLVYYFSVHAYRITMKQLSAMPLQNFLPVKALQFAHLFREYSHPVGHLLNFPMIKEVINNICIYIIANTVHIQCVCLTGCWLGNPLGAPGSKDRVWVTCCVTQDEVTTATNSTATEKALALRLMKIFFTEDKLAEGNCTPAAGRQVLDANILAGIRGKSHQFTVCAHCITIFVASFSSH